MTTEELNTIVQQVMAQIEDNALDFDVQITSPESNDYLMASRLKSDGTYSGIIIKWQDVAKVVTDVAVQAKTDAVNAKDIAQTILSQVQSKGTEITNFVATSKTEIATAKTEAVNAVQSVYQTDLTELKGDLGDVEDRIAPIDFRQKSNGKVILDVDVTGTMKAFMGGMEQEPHEAIALTLEPDVPTAESHNFGVRGQICIDSNYLYVCTALNTWKKISLLDL